MSRKIILPQRNGWELSEYAITAMEAARSNPGTLVALEAYENMCVCLDGSLHTENDYDGLSAPLGTLGQASMALLNLWEDEDDA